MSSGPASRILNECNGSPCLFNNRILVCFEGRLSPIINRRNRILSLLMFLIYGGRVLSESFRQTRPTKSTYHLGFPFFSFCNDDDVVPRIEHLYLDQLLQSLPSFRLHGARLCGSDTSTFQACCLAPMRFSPCSGVSN